MKYEKCNKALQKAIGKMAENCGRLWMMGVVIAKRDWERSSTKNEGLAIERKANQDATRYIHIEASYLNS